MQTLPQITQEFFCPDTPLKDVKENIRACIWDEAQSQNDEISREYSMRDVMKKHIRVCCTSGTSHILWLNQPNNIW